MRENKVLDVNEALTFSVIDSSNTKLSQYILQQPFTRSKCVNLLHIMGLMLAGWMRDEGMKQCGERHTSYCTHKIT